MAIKVDHTPYDAVGALAAKSGKALADVRASQFAHQMQMQAADAQNRERLMRIQQDYQTARQRFQIAAEQAAQQRQMEFQAQLLNAKSQIAMDMELQQFARKRQRLMTTLDEIDASEYLNPREKEALRIKALSSISDADIPGQMLMPELYGKGGATGQESPADMLKTQKAMMDLYQKASDEFQDKYMYDDEGNLMAKGYTRKGDLKLRQPTPAEQQEAQVLIGQQQQLSNQLGTINKATELVNFPTEVKQEQFTNAYNIARTLLQSGEVKGEGEGGFVGGWVGKFFGGDVDEKETKKAVDKYVKMTNYFQQPPQIQTLIRQAWEQYVNAPSKDEPTRVRKIPYEPSMWPTTPAMMAPQKPVTVDEKSTVDDIMKDVKIK